MLNVPFNHSLLLCPCFLFLLFFLGGGNSPLLNTDLTHLARLNSQQTPEPHLHVPNAWIAAIHCHTWRSSVCSGSISRLSVWRSKQSLHFQSLGSTSHLQLAGGICISIQVIKQDCLTHKMEHVKIPDMRDKSVENIIMVGWFFFLRGQRDLHRLSQNAMPLHPSPKKQDFFLDSS